MKRKFLLFGLALMAMATSLVSCSDNDEVKVVPQAACNVSLTLPLNVQGGTLSDATVTFTNVQTRQTYTASTFELSDGNAYADELTVPVGIYNVDVKGTVNYVLNGQQVSAPVKSSRANFTVNQTAEGTATNTLTLALSTYSASDGFVISELFFAGTQTPEKKQYVDDQYIKIANNSDSVMYADGLGIAQLSFSSDDKQDYTPNLIDSAITIDAIFVIPGDGKTYPVQPGQEITIAMNAINHKEYNAQSFDLSKADFEVYTQLDDAPDADTDNPDVPNLDNWYQNMTSAFVMHNRGFKSYALVRPEVTKEVFQKNFLYKYTWTFSFGEYSFPMDDQGYFIPNAWIVDAVDSSVKSLWQWNVMAPSIDAGYAYISEEDRDMNRYGKAELRKKNGTKWVDTNNSSNDFEAGTATLLRSR